MVPVGDISSEAVFPRLACKNGLPSFRRTLSVADADPQATDCNVFGLAPYHSTCSSPNTSCSCMAPFIGKLAIASPTSKLDNKLSALKGMCVVILVGFSQDSWDTQVKDNLSLTRSASSTA